MQWKFQRFRLSKRSKGTQKGRANAFETALSVRTLILGLPRPTSVPTPSLGQVKTDLLDPELANQVISQLHGLPVAVTAENPTPSAASPTSATIPVHAICLDCTDQEADEKWFSRLPSLSAHFQTATEPTPSVAHSDAQYLSSFIQQIHVIDLVQAPDFGIGQPTDGKGLLSGSIPTPKTLSDGMTKVTEQLMSLGFATSAAIWPSHAGVHPPLDRMSVITYWWGLEIVLPPPSMKYLSHVPSVSHAVLNFLSAVALVNNGVREILPFIRYISQYLDFEWNAIKAQDKGKGVVCAATWLMPAALIPRSWDFPPIQT